jgi:hypothetical protein
MDEFFLSTFAISDLVDGEVFHHIILDKLDSRFFNEYSFLIYSAFLLFLFFAYSDLIIYSGYSVFCFFDF